MKHSFLCLTRDDLARLRLLVTAALRSDPSPALEKLRDELDLAKAIEPAEIPEGIVTMGSCVKIEDIYSGEIEEYTLTYPEASDIGAGRLSVLTPIGTALLGHRSGEIVEWPTPGGIRRLKIHGVLPREVATSSRLPSAEPSPLIPAQG